MSRGYNATPLSKTERARSRRRLFRHFCGLQEKRRNSCLLLQSRYVLDSFGVVLMSCKVNFHVVRSAL